MVNERVSGASVLSRKVIAMCHPTRHRIPFHTHRSITAFRVVALLVIIVLLPVLPSPALAEVRVVNAQGEYRMGDRDTREDAIRLATEAAKRSALEQVAT